MCITGSPAFTPSPIRTAANRLERSESSPHVIVRRSPFSDSHRTHALSGWARACPSTAPAIVYPTGMSHRNPRRSRSYSSRVKTIRSLLCRRSRRWLVL